MTQVLKGHIVHAPALGRMDITENGFLVLEDGVIAGVYHTLPDCYAHAPLRDFGDKLIMQSFADMHLHAPQYPMLGMGMDLPLLDWLNTYTLIALLFDKYIAPSDIPTTGISKITADDIKAAASEGCKIKLIAHAYLEDGQVKASVAPEKLPLSHPLSGVSNEFNAVYITGDMVGELMFYGRGAGALPTGSAVVGDIIEIAKTI